MPTQITLKFDTCLAELYETCRECVAARVHQISIPHKTVAAEMDYSPSDLSRNLAQSPNDSRRFTLDDLERYVQSTGDTKPVLYLVEKYLAEENEIEALERRLAELKSRDKVRTLDGAQS